MGRLDDFMENAEKNAARQFRFEINDMYKALEDCPGTSALVEAALGLRNLCEGHEVEANHILFEANNWRSRYMCLLDIMRHDEVLRVPQALENLITEANYDILDDGWLGLVRFECHNVWTPHGVIEDYSNKLGDDYVIYRMNCNEYISKAGLKKNLQICQCMSTRIVDSSKYVSFKSIEDFTEFLKIIGDNGNYDRDNHKKIAEKLDALMHPEKVKEWEYFDD
jgi:hypothetical protein